MGGLRLILGGGGAAIFGALWFLGGLLGEDPESGLQGGIWKGPLLVVAGIGLAIMGVRMLKERFTGSGDDAPAHSS
jgi:hypothetical protein